MDASYKKITSKISRAIGILNRTKICIPSKILLMIYNSIIVPHFNYNLLLWGCKATKIFKFQKKAVRIILKEKYYAHTEPLFKTLKLLKISDLYTLAILKLYYKKCNHLFPGFYESYTFKTRSLIHEHNVRGKLQLHVPKIKHSCLKKPSKM